MPYPHPHKHSSSQSASTQNMSVGHFTHVNALTPEANTRRHLAANEQLKIVASKILPSKRGTYSAILPEPENHNDVYTCKWDENLPKFTLTVTDVGMYHAIFPLSSPTTRKFLSRGKLPPADLAMIENHTDPYGDTFNAELGTIHGEAFKVTLRSTGPTRDEKDMVFATPKISHLILFLDTFLQACGLIEEKFALYRSDPEAFQPKKRRFVAPLRT